MILTTCSYSPLYESKYYLFTPEKLPNEELDNPNAMLVTGLKELIPLKEELVLELFPKYKKESK